MCLWRCSGRIPPCRFRHLTAAGSPWHPCAASVPSSLLPCVCLSSHLSLPVRTPVIEFRDCPNPVRLPLNLIASLRTLFPSKVVLVGIAALGRIFLGEIRPTQTRFLEQVSGIGSLLATSSVTAAVLATILFHLRAPQASWWPPCTCPPHPSLTASMVFPKHKSVFLPGAENQTRVTPTPNPATASYWSWNNTQASCGHFLGPLAPSHPSTPWTSSCLSSGTCHGLCMGRSACPL